MSSKRLEQLQDLHFRVLRLLEERPDMSQRELAEHLGVSNGKVHYCLAALVEKGLVKLENFANSKHHLGYVYLLTPKGIAEKASLTTRFLSRKIREYEALQKEIALLQAETASQKRSSSSEQFSDGSK